MNARVLQIRLILVGLLAAASCPAVTSSVSDSPYSRIILRNVFDLKPPAPPPTNAPPPAPPSNLELTGVTTIFGKKQVMLNMKEQSGKSTAKMLTIGDPADEGIEVLSINESEGEVRVRNRGVESLLTFKTHGAKVPVGPAFAPPGVPRFQPPQTPQPTGITANPNAGVTPVPGAPAFTDGAVDAAATRTIPTRSVRVQPNLPQVNVPGAGVQPNQLQQQQQRPSSVEEQIIMMEINRQLNPGGPPLPPTPLTPQQ